MDSAKREELRKAKVMGSGAQTAILIKHLLEIIGLKAGISSEVGDWPSMYVYDNGVRIGSIIYWEGSKKAFVTIANLRGKLRSDNTGYQQNGEGHLAIKVDGLRLLMRSLVKNKLNEPPPRWLCLVACLIFDIMDGSIHDKEWMADGGHNYINTAFQYIADQEGGYEKWLADQGIFEKWTQYLDEALG
jgi:hypothetical protein